MINKPRVGLAGDPDSRWRLVADIGGTHARFALVDDYGAMNSQQTLKCDQFDGPAAAAQQYLKQVDVGSIRAAVIAVATAVYEDHVAFTNRAAWSFSIRELGQQLGVGQHLHVFNDFTALALSLPRLARNSLIQIGGGTGDPETPLAAIGPGTGLGVSGVIPTRAGWYALATEGGHVTLSPGNEREAELLLLLTRRFSHVSAERVLSGPGLVNLYWANHELAGTTGEKLTPADITERGLEDSSDICRTVLNDFCAMLGTVTGNLVLTIGARGGAYIGGGIVPRLTAIFADSPFRERFETHGRLTDYLRDVPCHIVTAEYPALDGALAALERDE
ncbi:MAG: glucokinase [Salinisphaera sp.]|jgi:glucokinase|nr:glucokinase [Salinisphaera sp.]